MAKAIIARRKGDTYQARVFWFHLLEIRISDFVKTVTFESDGVSFIDDVAVEYHSPMIDRLNGEYFSKQYIQCKYHMKQDGAFTVDALMDPEFVGTTESLLQRAYKAYSALADASSSQFVIQSNWSWHPDDLLAQHIHEGGLRDTFFNATKRSKDGLLRKRMADHLSISDDKLIRFLKRLRFDLGRDLARLLESLNLKLKVAGLAAIDPSVSQVVYDDLAWKLFEQSRNSFDKASLDALIRDENLLEKPTSVESEISIKSFAQFARRPADLQAAHLDITEHFQGRVIRPGSTWDGVIQVRVKEFLLGKPLQELPQPIKLFFDCHLSVAFLAGQVIEPKSGIRIIPVNKSGGQGFASWPAPANAGRSDWKLETSGTIATEAVLAVSVTHPVGNHVREYLKEAGMDQLPLILAEPESGTGARAVADGDHAWNLAQSLSTALRQMLPGTCTTLHVFMAVPAALAYIMGNSLKYVTPKICLYEHDFEGKNPIRYSPSMIINN